MEISSIKNSMLEIANYNLHQNNINNLKNKINISGFIQLINELIQMKGNNNTSNKSSSTLEPGSVFVESAGPIPSQGNLNDIFINTNTLEIFKKTNTGWNMHISLIND